MKVLSFDCANKSLAVCGININQANICVTIAKIKECLILIQNINETNSLSFFSDIDKINNLLKQLILIFISTWNCEYQQVFDLLPGKKVKDTTPVERCVLLKEAIKKINYDYDFVIIENQMRINEKSTGVLYCLLYEYGNKAKIIMPSEKNKLNLGGIYRCNMISNYSSAWLANKAHSKENFKIIAKEQNFAIPKKNISDIADAYFQCIAWYLLEN